MHVSRSGWVVLSVVVASGCGGLEWLEPATPQSLGAVRSELKAQVRFANENGAAETLSVNGAIDTTSSNPFFRSMGTNGRSCGTCHVPGESWSFTPEGARRRFDATDGLDPLFRPNDAATSPTADVSSVRARRAAYHLVLTRGLIRVAMKLPANREFELVAVDDPYRHASAAELSLFRRPLPTTNLSFLSTTMWDGRKSSPIADPLLGPNNATADLASQANGATLGHAQALSPVPAEVQAEIVRFELGLYTAQATTRAAGPLDEGWAQGGVAALSAQENYFGINDVLAGDSRTGAAFNPDAMTLFSAWDEAGGPRADARRAIARGQALFNRRSFVLSGVRGLNDVLGVAELPATCSSCHDAPNVGNHSVRLPVDLGLTDAARRAPELPLYTLCKRQVDEGGVPVPGTCDPAVAVIQTTDPGSALVTGKWGHVATFKGPILRALSGRAPYFHDGSAATLADVVRFYDERFAIGLSAGEQADLAAFLGAL